MKKILLFLLVAIINNFMVRAGDFSGSLMLSLSQYEKGIADKFLNDLKPVDCRNNKQAYNAALYFAIKHNRVKVAKKLFSLGISPN